MQFTLCLDLIYPKKNLREKLTEIKQAGFNFIELWDWQDKDFETITNSNLKVANFSGNRILSLTLGDKEEVTQEINNSIDVAKRLECDHIMFLSDRL